MQQLTEGTMRRNKRTGETQVLRNGQWVSQGGGAPSTPRLIPLAPPDPFKVRDQQLQEEAAVRAREDQEFQRQKFGVEMDIKRRELARADKPSATELEIANKEEGARKRAETVRAITGEVRRLYQQDIKGQPASRLFGATEYIDSIPANDRFRAAGNTILPLIRPLVAQSAKEGDSDLEMRVFQAYVPSNDDSDAAIEQKFKMLDLLIGGMVDGKPPSETLASINGAPQAEEPVYDANLGGEQLVRSTGGTKTIDNPALKGVRGEYLRRLGAGQSASEIIAFLRQAGISDPKVLRSAMEQIKFRQQNPNVPVEKYNTDALDDMDVPLSGVEGAMNDIGQSGAGAYLMRAGNAVTANNLDSIVGATGGNAERARVSLADAGRANPGAALAGDLSGGVLAALTGEAGLARFGMAPGLGRALAADAGYGAVAGAGAADGGDRLAGAGIGLAAGAAGSLAGNALTRGVGNALTGVTDRSVNALLQQKTPLTIGQAVGRSGRVGQIVKGVEDRVAGLPIVGDMVNARRTEGVRVMNSRAFDKALEPLGETVGNKVGEEAVEEAHGLVQQAFRDALAGKSAQLDVNFVRDAAAPLNRIRQIRRDGIGDEVVDQIEEATRGYFDPATGEITGENMQALLASLRQIRQSYRNDPLGHRIGGEVRKIETAVERIFERQTPDVMPKYRAAKQAFRRVSTLADAVNRGKNTEGVFTPGQLGMADRANSVKFDGSLAAASGKGQFHDFQRAAQDVLPNKVPDSGTAGRLATAIVPGAIAGSGAGIGYAAGDTQAGAQTGLGLATIVSALYTRQGQRALVALAAKRGPKTRVAGQKIKQKARIAGAAGGQAALGYTRD